MVSADPEHYELHHEDETHLETNPTLYRVWHRRGQQAMQMAWARGCPPLPRYAPNGFLTITA